MFDLFWTPQAESDFNKLAREGTRKKGLAQAGRFKQVIKALKLLQANPRHPGLQTHPYHSVRHPWSDQEKVFEAYVQNRTPGAYRIFWCYGPKKNQITVMTITPHP